MTAQKIDWKLLGASSLITATGLFISVAAFLMPATQLYSLVSSSLFPTIVGVALTFCGMALMFQSIRGGWACELTGEDKDELDPVTLLWIVAGFVAAMLVLFFTNSFVIAGSSLYVLSFRAFDNSNWIKSLIVGFLLSCIAYVIFAILLDMQFGNGVIERALQWSIPF